MKKMKKTSAMTWAELKLGASKVKAQVVKLFARTGINSGGQDTPDAGTEQASDGIQKSVIKMLPAFLLLLLGTQNASAQKSVVLDAFSKHGIDAAILDPQNLLQPEDYAYDLTQVTITTGKETIIVARFDPSGPKEEQWTVSSVNGKTPSRSDINSFRKGQSKAETANLTDDASYRIEKELSDKLVISYKPNPTSVPKDAAFMKDCRSYMTINIKNKQLEQVEVINEKPITIKILNAEKFSLVQKYVRIEQSKRYFPLKQDLNIQAKFMGQSVNVQTISEYSNYTKK